MKNQFICDIICESIAICQSNERKRGQKMQFVRVENLKTGMRLARPIYNKQGVLLFERDSKLTDQGISSIASFGLLGLFILEPAEPVPPMTEDDIEFERFQTMTVFSLQEELDYILNNKKQSKMQTIASNVTRSYGHRDKKINFIQNLRSREDNIHKHSLNVAILCTLMTHVMNTKVDEQNATILAALSHDMGKLSLSPEILDKGTSTPESRQTIRNAESSAYELIESVFSEGKTIRRLCAQSQKILDEAIDGVASDPKAKLGAKVLAVADIYDSMTAMKMNETPMSEVAAIKVLLDKPDNFDPQVVDALIKSINIVSPGISVELSTGEKALVITENENDILRPMVLSFRDNSIIDLSNRKMYGDIQIVDIMKTLDNRCIIDTETLKKAGFKVAEPEFV